MITDIPQDSVQEVMLSIDDRLARLDASMEQLARRLDSKLGRLETKFDLRMSRVEEAVMGWELTSEQVLVSTQPLFGYVFNYFTMSSGNAY